MINIKLNLPPYRICGFQIIELENFKYDMAWLSFLLRLFPPPFICGFAFYAFRLIVSCGPKILDGKSQK